MAHERGPAKTSVRRMLRAVGGENWRDLMDGPAIPPELPNR